MHATSGQTGSDSEHKTSVGDVNFEEKELISGEYRG